MKELWWYLGKNFQNSEEYLTQIRKSQTIPEYRMAVEGFFLGRILRQNPPIF